MLDVPDLKEQKSASDEFIELYNRYLLDIFENENKNYSFITLKDKFYPYAKSEILVRFFKLSKQKRYFDYQFTKSSESLFQKYESNFKILLDQFTFSTDEFHNTKSLITPKILSDLFEYTMQKEERQKSGSYYTSKNEVEFMCNLALKEFIVENTNIDKNNVNFILLLKNIEIENSKLLELKELISSLKILDPSCGTGIFLISMINILCKVQTFIMNLLNKPFNKAKFIEQILKLNIYGLDINKEALFITKMRILFQITNLEPNNSFEKLQINLIQEDALASEFPFKEKTKYFDIVIGNPPYVRQEEFDFNSEKDEDISVYKENTLLNLEDFLDNSINLPRDKKSDFYTYFFYRALSLTKPNGIICFITSNSWLDAKFGFNFKKILLQNSHIKAIYQNITQKSFSVAINTAITVLVNNPRKNKEFQTKFKKIIGNYQEESILPRFSEAKIVKQQKLTKILSQKKNFRNRWGAYYFRTSKIIHNIIEKNTKRFITLQELGTIRYPIKTGLNDFFILDEEIIVKFGIESEFLIPVLKSPKTVSQLEISQQTQNNKLFVCKLSKNELERKGFDGALKYILWGEEQETKLKQQTNKGIKWPDTTSVRIHIPYWYSISIPTQADVFCNRFFDKRFFFSFSKEKLIEDQTFYGLVLNTQYKKYKDIIIALLNSTFYYSIVEIFGRTSLGKGALQYTINDLKVLPFFNLDLFSEELEEKLINNFQPLLERNFSDIFSEVSKSDRLKFDELIFDYLGVPQKDRKAFYEEFLLMVKRRLEKSGQQIS